MVIKRYTKEESNGHILIKCIEETGHLAGAIGPVTKETKTMFWVDFVKPSGYRIQTSVRKDSIVE
jgi:hypothetical protein